MVYKNSRPITPEVCLVCGEDVPARAVACPECGADHQSGWKHDALNSDALGLPDDDFNYDDFVAKEFSSGRRVLPIKRLWWVTAIVLLISFILWLILHGRI